VSVAAFVRAINRATYPNPFDRCERVRRDGTAALRVTVARAGDRDCINLDGIRSLVRGQGYGSHALDWLCMLADRHHVTITGVIEPFGIMRPRMTTARLTAWYRRRGFVVTGDRHVYRYPQRQT
jgi:hypothetical protein